MEPSQNGRRKTVFSLDLTKILLESIYAYVTESESVTSKNISGSEKRAWVEGINVTVLMSITRPANFCPGKARKAYFLSADRTLSTVRTGKQMSFRAIRAATPSLPQASGKANSFPLIGRFPLSEMESNFPFRTFRAKP